MKIKQKKTKSNKSFNFSLFIKITLLLAASMLICVTAYGIYLTKKVEHAVEKAYEPIDERIVPEKSEVKVEAATDNVSVLFLGVDDSETRGQGADHSRTDALLLATLNNKSKTVKLVSIPRDSYVYIPYVGYSDKINHAHAYGGTLATLETVEGLFDIPIDYYVRLNFNAFIDVVDALGGVEVEVPYRIVGEKDEFDRNTMNFEPGLQLLDGRHALSLARTRKQDSDIERGKRQQQILTALTQKAATVTSISKYDDVIEALGNNIKTDMNFTEMKSFLSYLTSGMPQIDSLTLNGYDDMSTGIYYYKLNDQDLEETKQILKSHLGLIPDTSSISSSTSSTEYSQTDDLTIPQQ
ncbi:MAG: LCP family protein [Solibacillus sp.]